MDNNKALQAHLSMFTAEAIWGMMAPVGKQAMLHGIDSLDMVTFRVTGAAILFWIFSFFAPKEHVPLRDILTLALAALFGVTFNQCLFTLGLGITSPINASICTTSMPIFAMIIAFFVIHEPITLKKAGGVALGCLGAVILILTSMRGGSGKVGNIVGDIMCLCAQLSFAIYLSAFRNVIKRYSVFTLNKWMFVFASLYVWPFTWHNVCSIPFASLSLATWSETGFVVIFGTFVSYLLMMVGQRVLRPTVVSVYNYVQPIVSVVVSLLMGVGVFTLWQGLAIILVFSGVWMVTKSKSKRDLDAQQQ